MSRRKIKQKIFFEHLCEDVIAYILCFSRNHHRWNFAFTNKYHYHIITENPSIWTIIDDMLGCFHIQKKVIIVEKIVSNISNDEACKMITFENMLKKINISNIVEFDIYPCNNHKYYCSNDCAFTYGLNPNMLLILQNKCPKLKIIRDYSDIGIFKNKEGLTKYQISTFLHYQYNKSPKGKKIADIRKNYNDLNITTFEHVLRNMKTISVFTNYKNDRRSCCFCNKLDISNHTVSCYNCNRFFHWSCIDILTLDAINCMANFCYVCYNIFCKDCKNKCLKENGCIGCELNSECYSCEKKFYENQISIQCSNCNMKCHYTVNPSKLSLCYDKCKVCDRILCKKCNLNIINYNICIECKKNSEYCKEVDKKVVKKNCNLCKESIHLCYNLKCVKCALKCNCKIDCENYICYKCIKCK